LKTPLQQNHCYLTSCIKQYACNRPTRRSDPSKKFLHIPFSTVNYTNQSFEHATPSLWNSLPPTVRFVPTFRLKGYYFCFHLRFHLISFTFSPMDCLILITTFAMFPDFPFELWLRSKHFEYASVHRSRAI
jgi:hypothetical protein